MSGKEATILLVDDECPLLDVMKQLLSQSGYHVIGACSPEEALERWKQSRDEIDLLITDVNLEAAISGIELARVLLDDKETLKVIYISAAHLDDLGPDVDPQICLAKPFTFAVLTGRVSKVLDQKH